MRRGVGEEKDGLWIGFKPKNQRFSFRPERRREGGRKGFIYTGEKYH